MISLGSILTTAAVSATTLVAAVGAARAEGPPAFAMSNLSSRGGVSLALRYGRVTWEDGSSDVVSADVAAELPLTAKWKVFVDLPVNHFSGSYGGYERPSHDRSGTAVGNLSGGLRLVLSAPTEHGGRVSAGLALGISAPIGSETDDAARASAFGGLLNLYGDPGRNERSALRSSGSVRYDTRAAFVQGEVDFVDTLVINVFDGSTSGEEFFRASLGMGVEVGSCVWLEGGVTALGSFAAQAGARYDAGRYVVGAHLMTPIGKHVDVLSAYPPTDPSPSLTVEVSAPF